MGASSALSQLSQFHVMEFVPCNIPLAGICLGSLSVSRVQPWLAKAKMKFIQCTWCGLQSQRRSQAQEREEMMTEEDLMSRVLFEFVFVVFGINNFNHFWYLWQMFRRQNFTY